MARKILVVDDEKLIVKGIRFSLEQDGMEVTCAYDGEEALELAGAHSYDVILLDVMLPKLTGFEVCQQIREFSDVPIIMLTAKGHYAQKKKKRGERGGKPVDSYDWRYEGGLRGTPCVFGWKRSKSHGERV